jgi:hypothetical protein
LNAFWYHLCDWGVANHGDIRPLALAQFWAHVDDALDFNRLASLLKLKKPNLKASSGFQQLLEWVKQVIGRPGTSFETACTLTTAVNENLLTDLAREDSSDPVTMVAGMLTMLALIFLRYGDPATWVMPVWNISQMGADGRLSLQGFLSQVGFRLKSGPVTIREVVQWLFRDYVILQHQLVATGKLPENTFRFEREGDRLRFYNLPNFLTFNDSRFDAISTTVFELGLCGDLTSTDHGLTRDGQRLLVEGDL